MAQTVRLQLGDCIEVLRQLEDGSVGGVVCDPPYPIGKIVLTADTASARTSVSHTSTKRMPRC